MTEAAYFLCVDQNCSLLIKTVEESGGIMREIRDLEDQVCMLWWNSLHVQFYREPVLPCRLYWFYM